MSIIYIETYLYRELISHMLFLGPLYNLLARLYATRINHFALIKLSLLAIDKTILYFLVYLDREK